MIYLIRLCWSTIQVGEGRDSSPPCLELVLRWERKHRLGPNWWPRWWWSSWPRPSWRRSPATVYPFLQSLPEIFRGQWQRKPDPICWNRPSTRRGTSMWVCCWGPATDPSRPGRRSSSRPCSLAWPGRSCTAAWWPGSGWAGQPGGSGPSVCRVWSRPGSSEACQPNNKCFHIIFKFELNN